MTAEEKAEFKELLERQFHIVYEKLEEHGRRFALMEERDRAHEHRLADLEKSRAFAEGKAQGEADIRGELEKAKQSAESARVIAADARAEAIAAKAAATAVAEQTKNVTSTWQWQVTAALSGIAVVLTAINFLRQMFAE